MTIDETSSTVANLVDSSETSILTVTEAEKAVGQEFIYSSMTLK